ncbi:hypothetical protein HanRHA438_Chr10g0465761 [Helianthus annuus]|nr:hypothetical protein HanRHA438_Chr10g0465761 [Helianthus annuus]
MGLVLVLRRWLELWSVKDECLLRVPCMPLYSLEANRPVFGFIDQVHGAANVYVHSSRPWAPFERPRHVYEAFEETVYPPPEEDRGWWSSKPVPMHVSEQEVWNIEVSAGMNAIKNYQISQPNNATAIMPLTKRVAEDPMDVAVERVPQPSALSAAWVVLPISYLSPSGLAFVF